MLQSGSNMKERERERERERETVTFGTELAQCFNCKVKGCSEEPVYTVLAKALCSGSSNNPESPLRREPEAGALVGCILMQSPNK
jgi:hypothetical protein